MNSKQRYIAQLRNTYPINSRIICLRMNDQYSPVPPKTKGTVTHIDDAGTIHVKWDNGQTLGLVPETDTFQKVTCETEEVNLDA